jgi:hypothetical protein
MTTPDALAEQIKDLVESELKALKSLGSGMGIGEDGLKRLALCSLILYRIRNPSTITQKEFTNEELMKGGPIEQ